MRNRGYLFILIPIFVTTILWIFSKIYIPRQFDLQLYLSQYIALLAATLISIQFILASKFKIVEDTFGGLDRLFNTHHKIGRYAFILIIFHPVLLILNALPNLNIVKLYIIPSNILSYNFGIYTFYLFVLLLLFSLVIKLPFKYWRISHSLMGIPLLTLLLHIILISSDVSRFIPLRIWMLLLVTVAISCNFYIKAIQERRSFKYKVQSVRLLNPHILKITLEKIGEGINFKAGRFIFLSIKSINELKQYHPFSISSSPNSKDLSLIIKISGPFTKALKLLEKGDTADIQGPYGRFNLALEKEKSLWIAGGIGITPFISAQKSDTHIMHQLRSITDDVYSDLIKCKYVKYISEKGEKISIKELLKYISENNIQSIVMCGPKGFVNTIKLELIKSGIKPNQIDYELFELYSD